MQGTYPTLLRSYALTHIVFQIWCEGPHDRQPPIPTRTAQWRQGESNTLYALLYGFCHSPIVALQYIYHNPRLTDYAPSVRVVRLIVVQSPSVLVNRSPLFLRLLQYARAGFCKVFSMIPSTCRGCRGTRNLCLCPTKLTDLVNTQPVYYLDSLSATAP